MAVTVAESHKLVRILRFDELLIGASAIPMPLAWAPSIGLQGVPADLGVAPNDQHDAPSPGQSAATEAADLAHTATPAGDGPVADDAVSKSLQAAINAIHGSLQHASGGDDGPILAPTGSHQSVDSPLDAAEAHLLPADAAASSAISENSGSGDLLSPATSAIGALPTVANETLGVSALATEVLDTTTSLVMHAADVIEAPVLDALQATSTAASSATQMLSAVTIPSLGGLGFDSMAGLLHPPTAPLEAAHFSEIPRASLEDSPIFAAIGAPDVFHVGQDMDHQGHSTLHLVGSGLI